ncbi:hypothetical protein Ciccas_010309 [Cichlidogyrus casuarinus]|uniref:Dynein regulatory complex protein 10 n=1 Tax=Cichlidogyrus casuarinus TaxID=1844966 RepID=A0ABD2PVK8_9PLAT
MDALLNIRQNRVAEEDEYFKLVRLKSNDFWTRRKSADTEIGQDGTDLDLEPAIKVSHSGINYFVYSAKSRDALLAKKLELTQMYQKKKHSLSERIKSVLTGFRGACNEAKAYSVMKLRKNLPGQKPPNYTTLQESPRELSEYYVPEANDLLLGEYAFSEAIAHLRKLTFVHLLTSPEEVEKQKIKLDELKDKTNLHKQQINKLMGELQKAEETQLVETKKLLEDVKGENLMKETDERVIKFKKEAEIETFIAKFDSEMLALYNEYERIDADYTEEKKELGELEEKFKTLSEEYEIIMEKRRLEAERLRLENERKQALMNAATTIQSFWRSFKTRKLYRGKKGRKGKGK